jgi:tRNA acetyltransferase TAN1
MVDDMHKVNLTSPDRVIIVEIYQVRLGLMGVPAMGRCTDIISRLLTHVSQTVCGMSVVGGDWEELKRFNLAELYQPTKPPPMNKAEANPKGVTTNEAPPAAITDSLVA